MTLLFESKPDDSGSFRRPRQAGPSVRHEVRRASACWAPKSVAAFTRIHRVNAGYILTRIPPIVAHRSFAHPTQRGRVWMRLAVHEVANRPDTHARLLSGLANSERLDALA